MTEASARTLPFKWPNEVAMFLSSWAIVIGSFIILGWTFDIPFLKSVSYHWASMKANAAVCSILLGFSLILLSKINRDNSIEFVARVLSLIAFIIAFLTLLEYAYNKDFGIDQFLFHEFELSTGTAAPGRMTPLTAVSFMLIAFSLIFLDSKVIGRYFHYGIAFIVLYIALFQFLNYLYGIQVLKETFIFSDQTSQMSASNSLVFILLGLSIPFARPYKVSFLLMSEEGGGAQARRLIFATILVIIVLGGLKYVNQWSGYYALELFFSLLITASIFLLISLILSNALLINKMEAERTEVKKTLKWNQEQLNLALKSAEAGSWIWNISKNQIIWDERIYSLFGMPIGNFSENYEDFIRLIHPGDQDYVNSYMQKIINSGVDLNLEYRIVHPDGFTHYIGSKGKVYRDNKGNPTQVAGICLDISDRKRTEEELRFSKEMAERLAEKAESASHAKTSFLASMSHEIRTPLNGVIGMTTLLSNTTLSPDQHEYVKTIFTSSNALLSVINDILDFSKIESGHMELEIVDFRFSDLIKETTEMIGAQANEKGLLVNTQIDDNVPQWVIGDASRIRQILSNLLSNAIKFTHKGRIDIKASVIDQHEKQSIILFEVKDTGIGISPEIRSRLFKMFSQGDPSMSRKYGGTGLGLAISKRLAKMMGGMIDVESTPGKGSRFWFTIPLGKSYAPHPPSRELLSSQFSNAPLEIIIPSLKNPNKTTKILLVEDNLINQQVELQLLNRLGYYTEIVENGLEAIEATKKVRYDLILMDCQMPEMDGYTTTSEIRKLESKQNKHTPIIAMTAHTMQGDQERCLASGMDDYIPKPVNINLLGETLSRWLWPKTGQDKVCKAIKE